MKQFNFDKNKLSFVIKRNLTDVEREYFKAGIGYFINDPNFKDFDNIKGKFISGDYDDRWLQRQYNHVFIDEYGDYRVFTQEMIDTGFFYAIDYQGNKVQLIKKLGDQDDQNVFEGLLINENNNDNIEVVVKWVDVELIPISEEIQNWADLIATYTSKGQVPNTPYIDDNFYLLGQQVMVIEKLEPLTNVIKNDIANFTAQILDQLQHLHEFACHSDLKPDNIMKRIGQEKYFIIDLGSIAREKLNYGYKRHVYTPNFTSQINYYTTIITPKYDLLEFGFILSYFTLDYRILASRTYEYSQRGPTYWRYDTPHDRNVELYLKIINIYVEDSVTSRTYELLNTIMNVPKVQDVNIYLQNTNPETYQELRNLGVLI